jgi:hypothetical protein
MSFSVPAFPLLCDIYTGPWLTRVLRVSAVPCNLGLGKRTLFYADDFYAAGSLVSTQLLLPAGTDVRSGLIAPANDMVEVPQGSNRWYQVQGVEDAGKGFGNEHRVAILSQVSQFVDATLFAGCVWPVPMT